MGLARYSLKEIETHLANVVRRRTLAEDKGFLSELPKLEEEEDNLWQAWHTAHSGNGFARL